MAFMQCKIKMKKLFLVMFMGLGLVGDAGAARANNSESTSADGQSVKQTPASQSVELAEADQLNKRVVQLHDQGKDDEALLLASRVLEIREKALGPDDRLVAFALFNLGEIYIAKSKYGTAEPLYNRALSILEKSPEQNDVMVSRVLSALAFLRYADRDFQKSETLFKRALAIKEKSFGAESLEVAPALFSLAELYRLLSKYEKAEELYIRLIAIQEKSLKPYDPGLGKSYERYLCLLYESGKEKEAHEFEKQLSERTMNSAKLNQDEILNGKALSLPKPVYPVEARRVRAQGVVRVKIAIDEAGNVTQAEAICGHSYLRKTSETAALKARFTPTLKGGQPIKLSGIINYRFIPQ